MKKCAMLIEVFSNSGKQSYGTQYVAIIKEENVSDYFRNQALPSNFKILEISEGWSDDLLRHVDTNNSLAKKIKYDHAFTLPRPEQKILEREEVKSIFTHLLEIRNKRTEERARAFKIAEAKKESADAILAQVENGFRVWVILSDGRKAVIDKKKLLIYQAKTAPLCERNQYADGYEKRVLETNAIISIGVKKRLFQKRIKTASNNS